MPIYSNLYSNLARQGFAKTFTHGYAQSVVAATHPSTYPSQQNRSPFARRHQRAAKLHNYNFKNAFHTSVTTTATVVQQDVRQSDKQLATDAGLTAYFDAWRKQHPAGEPEQEWTQFQFTKRIEWKPIVAPAEKPAAQVESVEEVKARDAANLEVPVLLERSHSASDLDSLRRAEQAAVEAVVIGDAEGRVTPEIARQIRELHIGGLNEVALNSGCPTPPLSLEDFRKSPLSGVPAEPSTSDLQSQSYAEHLTKLSETQRYAEIPAVFEAMLVAGIRPVAESYNALLDAAIHLPCERIQVVPKALDVYSDMLRRKVQPNTATYNTLINLIATRSLEIASQKKMLEEKRARFGGMEKPGQFMLASNELELEILAEDDRLDYAIKMFDLAAKSDKGAAFPSETYHALISACAEAGRVPEMARFYDDMDFKKVLTLSATFPEMIKAHAAVRDLNSVVECYNEYKDMAVADNYGLIQMKGRKDAFVYAAVVKAYVDCDKFPGAVRFFEKLDAAYGGQNPLLRDVLIAKGLVQGLLDRGIHAEALRWAEEVANTSRPAVMSLVATAAADAGDRAIAVTAWEKITPDFVGIAKPAMAMLAMSVRLGHVAEASRFWQVLSMPEMQPSPVLIEPTVMYAIALIGTGQVAQGLDESEHMFQRIKAASNDSRAVGEEVEEGALLIQEFMAKRGVVDPRNMLPPAPVIFQQPPMTPAHYPAAPTPAPQFQDTFDPYAASTDFKGSALIADELERGMNSRHKGSRLSEALGRFRNIRRAGRHPRYITYAKLIAAAAREERMELVHDILGMARSDVPLLMQYPVVRYGWVSILDAMVGACLTLGNRQLAAKYHQELLDMGAAPTANTFGLYITTLKESTKTFDEATEAVKIFHRAKSEGVEPSSFLYNALIGKLGKARRIDDCLFYFAEMRAHGIRPTSVTYGTIVNALCRVSDEKFAEELFEEMESMPNYKARPAPYNSLMQFFLTTKRDKAKVLQYYERMKSRGIRPTGHTYKLLIDTHATLEPVNMQAAETVLDLIRASGETPEPVHYSSLIHAKGCVQHDLPGAVAIFNSVLSDPSIRPQACLFQSVCESMVAAHRVRDTEAVLRQMTERRVEMTPYIANTLIHGWAGEGDIAKAREIFEGLGYAKREPSTYEAMTRAYLAVEDRASAMRVVQEMLQRGYPNAVSSKILEIVGFGHD
jgi:pentatricopeptide repeat protein